ncbi:MAG TPA: STAS domain-containing protein [Anaerolineales bacterium]|jgi:anti-sigma B factor antagonist|nr:STAS domain-containing protein [Anaerolineales bacterium]
MEITTQEINHVELITVKGRVDSVESVRLAKALESASRRGKHKIVVDMSEVQYMSSAGFRALGDAQRNSHHHQRGEVILARVPASIHEALELVGFTEYFPIKESVKEALALAESSPTGDSSIPG